MSEAVHLDGLNVAYSIRWGKGMTKVPPEWERLKSAIEYFQAFDVEIHIHVPAWTTRIQRLCEDQLENSVNFHYIYIPDSIVNVMTRIYSHGPSSPMDTS